MLRTELSHAPCAYHLTVLWPGNEMVLDLTSSSKTPQCSTLLRLEIQERCKLSSLATNIWQIADDSPHCPAKLGCTFCPSHSKQKTQRMKRIQGEVGGTNRNHVGQKRASSDGVARSKPLQAEYLGDFPDYLVLLQQSHKVTVNLFTAPFCRWPNIVSAAWQLELRLRFLG